jgi:hypothetical protein
LRDVSNRRGLSHPGARKGLILDTSILCVRLEVPGLDSCGHATDKWNRQRVMNQIKTEEKASTIFV